MFPDFQDTEYLIIKVFWIDELVIGVKTFPNGKKEHSIKTKVTLGSYDDSYNLKLPISKENYNTLTNLNTLCNLRLYGRLKLLF